MLTAKAIEQGKSFDGPQVRDQLETISGFQGTTGVYNMSPTVHQGITVNPLLVARSSTARSNRRSERSARAIWSEGASARYGSVEALHAASLSVATANSSPSSAEWRGKSTLMRAVMGLVANAGSGVTVMP